MNYNDKINKEAGIKELFRKWFFPNEAEVARSNLEKSIDSMEYNIDKFEKKILSTDIYNIPDALFRFKDFTRIYLTQFVKNFETLKKLSNHSSVDEIVSVKSDEELAQIEKERQRKLQEDFDLYKSKINDIFNDLKYFDKFISVNKNKPLIKKINTHGSKLINKLISVIGNTKNVSENDLRAKYDAVDDYKKIINDYNNLLAISNDISDEIFASYKEYTDKISNKEKQELSELINEHSALEYSVDDVDKIYNDLKYFDHFIKVNKNKPLIKKINLLGSKLINKLLIFISKIKTEKDQDKINNLLSKFDSIQKDYIGLLKLANDISDDSFDSFEDFYKLFEEHEGEYYKKDDIFIFNDDYEIEKNAVNPLTRFFYQKKLKLNPFKNSIKPIRLGISNEIVKLRKIISEIKKILKTNDKNMFANIDSQLFTFKICMASIIDYLIQLVEKYRDLQKLEVIDKRESIKIDVREISLLNKLKNELLKENEQYLENISVMNLF